MLKKELLSCNFFQARENGKINIPGLLLVDTVPYPEFFWGLKFKTPSDCKLHQYNSHSYGSGWKTHGKACHRCPYIFESTAHSNVSSIIWPICSAHFSLKHCSSGERYKELNIDWFISGIWLQGAVNPPMVASFVPASLYAWKTKGRNSSRLRLLSSDLLKNFRVL